MKSTIALVLLAGAALAAQQTQRQIGAGSAPTVVVDFAAVDAKGMPVTDLTAADITVRIDGKVKVVKDLQMVKRETTAAAADPLPAPFASNVATGNGGRAVFMIIDNETVTTGREQRVTDGLTLFINSLGPQDVASIMTVPHGGVAVELTSDRQKLKEGAAKVIGARNPSESGDDAACRSRLTLQAMQQILSQRADATTPTDVVFVSSSLVGPRNNVTSGNTRLGRGSVGQCELSPDEFSRLSNIASSARARIYVVQPEQLGSATDANSVGLESVAGLTGGYVWHMAGSDEPGFQRIAAETSSYYNATVELEPGDVSPGRRPLALKTSRPDVTLRVNPMIGTAAPGASAAAKSAPSPKDMLRTATVYRDVPLRVQAFSSRAGGKVRVLALAEPGVPGTKLSAAAVGLYDGAGKLVGQWTASAADLTAPALMATFDQNPGTYRARVAVTDTAGRSGAADVPAEVGLTPAASGLSLSSIVLLSADGVPKLQFSNDASAVAYFELYGGKPGMPVSINVELASTLNGPALATLQPKIAGSPEADKYLVTTPVNLGALPPGDYIVRAIVGLDGFPATRILRTLRKTQ